MRGKLHRLQRSGWAAAGLLLLALFSGCATSDPYTKLPRTGDPYQDAKAYATNGPPRDRLLWQSRAALAALRRGYYDEAKSLLDPVILQLGGLTAGDPTARRARRYFSEESVKTFRGEPYERVAAYYYRGLLYWRDGEVDNARACFRNAQIQDSEVETNTYAADYVLLDYLDGLATTKLGGDGSDAYQRARAACKIAEVPPYAPNANVLVFLDYGAGPTKYATGAYNEQLRIRPGHSPAREVMIKVNDQLVAHVGPYDDLTFQATTRGGREMDHILANKAVFKGTADAVGNAALLSGIILAGNHNTDEAALGVLAAGLISKILAGSTRPEADTRSWDNLPQYLSFSAVPLPPGQHQLTVDFLDEQRRSLPHLMKTLNLTVGEARRDTVVYINDQSTTPQTL